MANAPRSPMTDLQGGALGIRHWLDGRALGLWKWGRQVIEAWGTTAEDEKRMQADQVKWPSACYWWIDGVGSYLVIFKREISIGQASTPAIDIPIFGDLRSHHASIVLGSAGALLVAKAPTSVHGVEGESFLLKNGDIIRLRSVELRVRRPNPMSASLLLELASRHRWGRPIDGVIILGETGSVGPRSQALVRTPWPFSLHVNWHQSTYWVRGPEDVKVDGKATGGCASLRPDSQISTPAGNFRWEPVQDD